MSDENLAAYTDLLDVLGQLRRLRPTAELIPDGITPSEMGALIMIGHAQLTGQDIRPSFIAAHTHTSKGAVSQNLKSLEEKGLIVRVRSSEDARAVRILLTDSGHDTCMRAHEMRNLQMQALMDYLGSEDIEHLTRIVRRIVAYEQSHGAYLEEKHACCEPGSFVKEGGSPCV